MPHPSPPPPPHPLLPNAHYSTFLSYTRQYFVGGVGVGESDVADQYLDPLHVVTIGIQIQNLQYLKCIRSKRKFL
jgi:hypothetical protein